LFGQYLVTVINFTRYHFDFTGSAHAFAAAEIGLESGLQ
jgi:hypothetical protein